MFSTVLSLLVLAQTQNSGPFTKAETTHYQETSTYADVVKFLDDLKASGAPIDIRSSGMSTEGRKIPMVIAARPMVSNPEEAARSGKLVIYIQANIHAGEVEGKEAALQLLRRYCREKKGVLDNAILIVQPIYNIDGNEKFAPQARNRPGQNGPEMVGVRPNGQNLDLNRDCMKAESPEMQGVLKFVYPWNPDVMFDLHTTDGTRHGYQMTYAGPLDPNTNPAIQKYELDELLPTVRKTIKTKFNRDLFDYGNGETDKDKNWRFETFGGEPRYVTNYAGMRNTLSILTEAMVYETFENRVHDTEQLVDESIQKMIKDRSRIKTIRKRAMADKMKWGMDPSKSPKLATRYKMKLRGNEPVLLEKNLLAGGRRSGPVRDVESITMPVFDRFEGEKFAPLPYAYIFPKANLKAYDLLKLHGVKVNEMDSVTDPVYAEEFHVTTFGQARGAFQGHKLITLDGTWNAVNLHEPGYIVFTSQPLGLLAFELLEPDCTDGLTSWGFFGESFPVNSAHPVLRVLTPTKIKLKQN